MLFAKYVLLIAGLGLLIAALALLTLDLARRVRLRRRALSADETEWSVAQLPPIRWRLAASVGLAGAPLVLLALSIVVVPAGMAGVRVSQISGTLPGTLYPGTHLMVPLVHSVSLYSTRDNVFTTRAAEGAKDADGALRVQSKEGLSIGLAVSVRYRLDPQRLAFVHDSLPESIQMELVSPLVASAFRQTVPNYLLRDVLTARREEVRRLTSDAITRGLATDGIIVKEVMLRDVALPPEYAKGLEGLLLKAQENDRLTIDLEVKQKMVRAAELEAEAEKARQVKGAEAAAQMIVLQAKAQADAMQHTLPLKEKQIQQSRLEAEARKEATVKNAEAMAQAKVIDSRAELERQGMMAKAEEQRIRLLSGAESERMRAEAQVLKDNPLLIQKIIAERLSDKVQIMMVPMDGKFFFANDVLKGSTLGLAASRQEER